MKFLILMIVMVWSGAHTAFADESHIVACGKYTAETTASLGIVHYAIAATVVDGQKVSPPVNYILNTVNNLKFTTEQKLQQLTQMRSGDQYCVEGFVKESDPKTIDFYAVSAK
jgi:hypothetical protein